jgi:HrpA-like RNA helicase
MMQDSLGEITAKGRKMARLPLEPQYAAALLAADSLQCVWDCLAVVSMVSAERVFVSSRQMYGSLLLRPGRHEMHGTAVGVRPIDS